MPTEVIEPTLHARLAADLVSHMVFEALRAGLDRHELATAMISRAAALLAVRDGRRETGVLLRGAADHIERALN